MAKYQDVYLEIAEKIVNGELAAGTKLPSGEELAQQYNISYITARKVYELLCRNRLVDSRPRQGFFVHNTDQEVYCPEQNLQLGKVGLLLSMNGSMYCEFYNQLLLRLVAEGHAPVSLGFSWMMKNFSHDKAKATLLSYAGAGVETLIIRGDGHFPYKALWEVRKAFRKIIFVMFYSGDMPFDGAAKVLFDMRQAGRLAAEYMLENCFNKFVFITQEPAREEIRRKHGVSSKLFDLDMLDGIEDVCNKNNIDFYDCGRIIARNMPLTDAECDLRKNIIEAIESGCNAFVCMNDTRALAVYQTAAEIGIKVGKDIGVTGNFNTSLGEALSPALPSIDLNIAMLVEGVANALANDTGNSTMYIQPKIIKRK